MAATFLLPEGRRARPQEAGPGHPRKNRESTGRCATTHIAMAVVNSGLGRGLIADRTAMASARTFASRCLIDLSRVRHLRSTPNGESGFGYQSFGTN